MFPRDNSPRSYNDNDNDDDDLQRAIEISLQAQQTNSGRQERIEAIFRIYDNEPCDGVIEYHEFKSMIYHMLWLQYGELKAKNVEERMTIFLATIAVPHDEERDYLIPDDFLRLADRWQTNITRQNQIRNGHAIACPWEFQCDNFISIAEPGLIEKLQEIKIPKPKSETESISAQPCDLTALIRFLSIPSFLFTLLFIITIIIIIRLYHDDYPISPLPLHKFNSLIYDLTCIHMNTLELDDFNVLSYVELLCSAFSSQSLDEFTMEQILTEWKMHLRLNNLHGSNLYSIWENASTEMIQKLKSARLNNLIPSTNWVYTSLERRGMWVSPDIIKQMNGWRLINIDQNAALVMQIPSSQQDLNDLFNFYLQAVPIMTISAFRRWINSNHHIPIQKEFLEKQTENIRVFEASDIIDTELNKLGYSLTRTMDWRSVMAPDGNCFYRAVAFTWYGNANLYQSLRANIARMYSHDSILESVFGSKRHFWDIIIRPIEPRLNNLEYNSTSSQVMQQEIDNYIASIQSDGQWNGAGQVDDALIKVTAIYLNTRIVVFDMSNIERNIQEGRHGVNELRTYYTVTPLAHTENTIFILRVNGVHYDAINITSLRNTL